MLKPIGIIGAGGWGIAWLRCSLIRANESRSGATGRKVFASFRRSRESRTYLAGIVLPSSIKFTRSIEVLSKTKTLIICVVPSHTVREVIASAASQCVLASNRALRYQGLEEEV